TPARPATPAITIARKRFIGKTPRRRGRMVLAASLPGPSGPGNRPAGLGIANGQNPTLGGVLPSMTCDEIPAPLVPESAILNALRPGLMRRGPRAGGLSAEEFVELTASPRRNLPAGLRLCGRKAQSEITPFGVRPIASRQRRKNHAGC